MTQRETPMMAALAANRTTKRAAARANNKAATAPPRKPEIKSSAVDTFSDLIDPHGGKKPSVTQGKVSQFAAARAVAHAIAKDPASSNYSVELAERLLDAMRKNPSGMPVGEASWLGVDGVREATNGELVLERMLERKLDQPDANSGDIRDRVVNSMVSLGDTSIDWTRINHEIVGALWRDQSVWARGVKDRIAVKRWGADATWQTCVIIEQRYLRDRNAP